MVAFHPSHKGIILALALVMITLEFPTVSTEATFDKDLLFGKFEMVSNPANKDLHQFLAAMGVSKKLREFLQSLQITFELQKLNIPQHYELTVGASFIKKSFSFQLGKEIHWDSPTGLHIVAIIEFKDNHVLGVIRLPSGESGIIKTDTSPGGFTADCRFKDVVAKTEFERTSRMKKPSHRTS